MKSKTLKKKADLKLAGGRKSISRICSDVLRFSRRHTKYAFVASLGVWLPKADAATLVNLDATTQPLGDLTTWPNTGTLPGDFIVGPGATTNPVVVLVDGISGVALTADGGIAGAGSHYVGPATPTSLAANNPRTIEAWIHNDSPQDAEAIVGWGRRGADGLNNFLGHGGNTAWGGAEMWGAPDLGWGNTPAQVATNRVINRWTYIVQTFDGTTNTLYVDGRLANLEGPPATSLINTPELADDAFTALPIRVARESEANGTVSTASVGNFVAGRIRIHDAALSSSTISNQFFVEKGSFNLNDTDGDGMPDWWEIRYGLDANNPADATLDAGDSDGLNNLAEFVAGTDPTNPDTDGDGATDGAEVNRIDPQSTNPAPTDPLDTDTDDDGLFDGVETDTGTYVSPTDTGSDPLLGDSDGDIASDGYEVAAGTDPNNAGSTAPIFRAIELDATGLTGGTLLTNWINTGFITGNFSVPTNATVPSVTARDGVNGVQLLAVGGAATGTHYVGPATTAEVTASNPRTVEAWVFDTQPQGEKVIIAWGKRAGASPDGANFPLGIGTQNDWGAVAAWGTPDIGWNDQEVHGRWTHIAATWDGTTTRLYSEGVQVNIETPTPTINTVLLDTGLNPLPFRIGRQNNEAGGIDATGQGEINIARVRVYTNALDTATIKARFDSEKATFGLTDTDGDGLPTWYEIRNGLDPNDSTGPNGAGGNPDNDGLTNLEEFNLGTAAGDADTDDDGVNDGAEVNRIDPQTTNPAPTNPLLFDTDNDGLRDGVETDTGTYVNALNTGTDPLVADTDGDGFSDGLEVSQGSNPLNPGSLPDPSPRINLVSTNLALGTHTEWINTGTFSNGMAFASTNGGGTVQVVAGVTAMRFPGPGATGPFFTGPTNPAAANLTGNPLYSIEAWIYNESVADEEIILGWGRRGADGLNSAFGHGLNPTWGAVGHWGAPDFPWGSNSTAIASVIIPNQWSYLVYTFDPQTGIQRGFVNGVQVNEEAGITLNLAAVADNGNPAPIRVGGENNADGTPRGALRAAGLSIAELRVYTRVLSPTEISSNFTTGRNVYGLGDNDNDGITDWYERIYPACLSEANAADAALDCDSDGLSNLLEFQNNTDPTNPDSDGDGLSDGDEVINYGSLGRPFPTSPNDPDTDRDGLNDNVETGTGVYVSPQNPGTIANFADSDGDLFPDSTEVAYRVADGVTDPNNPGLVPNTATPVPVVKLDATTLATGALSTWTNLSGLPSWDFVAPTGAVASVAFVDGTRGVVLNTTNYYTGHGAPAHMGGNASRTVDAWIYNPTRTGEETVFAWGRRGGPDGSNFSLIHGTDAAFGAMGIWGAGPDVPWGANATDISNNVVTSKWTYVTYVYDNTANVDGVRAVYRDGVFAHSETNAVGVVLNTHVVNTLTAGGALPFRVGAQNEADGSRSGAGAPSMTIAKVRVYDQALTAAQIADTYNAERIQFPGQPRITNVQVNPNNGFVSFDWTPAAGHTYAVERATNAANPSAWSTIATGQTSGSFTNDPAGAPQMNYRLRLE